MLRVINRLWNAADQLSQIVPLFDTGERLPCFWSLIWPMLTETGRREYREEVERRGGV